MDNLLEKLAETAAFINARIGNAQPETGIILGTGLGGLVNDIEVAHVLPYEEIPNFPVSTVESHSGKLIFGWLGGKRVVAMQGRFHYYEGYCMKKLTFPVRVMQRLGIGRLFISNAAGSTCAHIRKGDLMIIKDHINLHYENPLRGKNYDALGPRFPDMSEPYSLDMVAKGLEIAERHGFSCHAGVFASVPGPNLETRAEYRFLNIIGADAVGMSTVPEVIVAVHGGLPVFAISVITDEGFPPEDLQPLTVEEVIAVAREAEPKMTTVMRELIATC